MTAPKTIRGFQEALYELDEGISGLRNVNDEGDIPTEAENAINHFREHLEAAYDWLDKLWVEMK